MRLTGREKATIFLSILGSETSGAILRYLPEELADLIASSVNHLPTPTPEALGEIFHDFQSYVALPPASKPGATEPDEFEIKAELTPQEKLLSVNGKKVARLLSAERPQIAAFILSALPPMRREEILMNISGAREQVDQLLDNIKLTPVSQELREKLVNHFAEKL